MSGPLLFPVYGFNESRQRETVAVFFTGSDAETFVMHPEQGFEPRNLYGDVPQYDKRVGGYRPPETDWRASYRAWLESVDAQLSTCLPDPIDRRDAA